MLPLSTSFPIMHAGDLHALWPQKSNGNFKSAWRIPHSLIRASSRLPNQGIKAVLFHSSGITTSHRTDAKPQQARSRASFPSSNPRPPLITSSLTSLVILRSHSCLPLLRPDAMLALQSNPVTLPLSCTIPSPQSPKEPSAKDKPKITASSLAPPAHRLCFVSRFVWIKQSIGNLPYP